MTLHLNKAQKKNKLLKELVLLNYFSRKETSVFVSKPTFEEYVNSRILAYNIPDYLSKTDIIELVLDILEQDYNDLAKVVPTDKEN